MKTRAAVLAAFAALLVLTPLDMAGTDSELATADGIPGDRLDRDSLDRGTVPPGELPAEFVPVMKAG